MVNHSMIEHWSRKKSRVARLHLQIEGYQRALADVLANHKPHYSHSELVDGTLGIKCTVKNYMPDDRFDTPVWW